MSGYFNLFPSLLYANTAATNIIAKIQFDAVVLKRSVSFYPYTITNDERADHVAENYYGDASYDWLVYLSNNIIDPHNEWPKSEGVMVDFIEAKYGSVANSQLQTAFYQVGYAYDDRVIGTNVYAALSGGQKKYWNPIINSRDQVINYQRKPLDTVVETNKIVMLTGQFNGIGATDLIKQADNVTGTVSFANTSTLMIKHVNGTWTSGDPVYFRMAGGVANATITSTTTINETIPNDEIDYWYPVSHYESEVMLNDSRKHIKLLSAAFVDVVERDMKDLL